MIKNLKLAIGASFILALSPSVLANGKATAAHGGHGEHSTHGEPAEHASHGSHGALAAAEKSEAHHEVERALSPEKAYKELVAGNNRFVEGDMSHKNADSSRRKELAQGQKPHSIILSCSDSRTAPELVFDQGLGDLFPIRVAGNVLGAAQVASIEYAVEHLGTNLIVVMGHESCGAVKAAVTTPKKKSAGTKDLDHLVAEIRGNMGGSTDRAIASEDKTMRKPVMANVDGVSERLLSRSKLIKKYVDEGKVRIVRGIYSLESGKVDFWANEGLK